VPNGRSVAPPPPDPPDARDWRVEQRGPDRSTAQHRIALVDPARRPDRAAGNRRARVSDLARLRPASQQVLGENGPALAFGLGAVHYLRSEPSWDEAGAPAATVRVRVADGVLIVDVDVRLGRPPAFLPAGASNPYDNERADVNSDGLQLYLRPTAVGGPSSTWLLVPEPPLAVRQTVVSGAERGLTLDARWAPRADGWQITCRVPLAGLRAGAELTSVLLDVAVNEKPPGRARRRGQLRLAEQGSPFVYLRGDRMDGAGAVPILLLPAAPAPPVSAP
jgi:hypothetical protein